MRSVVIHGRLMTSVVWGSSLTWNRWAGKSCATEADEEFKARNSYQGSAQVQKKAKICPIGHCCGKLLVGQIEQKESVEWSSLCKSVFVKKQLFFGNVSKFKMGKWETIVFWLSHFAVMMSNCFIYCKSKHFILISSFRSGFFYCNIC